VVVVGLFAFFCLILLGRMNHARKRQAWMQMRISYSTESWTDLNLAVPIAALVLVLLAWFAPAVGTPAETARAAWERITHPFESMRSDLANVVAGVQGRHSSPITEFYGETLTLGQQASSGEQVYLQIQSPIRGSGNHFYWHVRTYDQFIDNKWKSNYTFNIPFSPNQAPIPLEGIGGYQGEFVFYTPDANLVELVTPTHPVWVSRPSVLSFTPLVIDTIDPLMFRADPPILVGEHYNVDASIQNPSILQLQNANTVYPATVLDHYLQLPGDLSARITELARNITKDAGTAYDKATAITEYLRSNIRYSTVVNPPSGGDPLVWFLFDHQAGFCNYYATAEVILLRSVGIPARMVVGFAEGEYVSPNMYTVREKDAHAWPEVYFSGIGWVGFEPTSSQPDIARPLGDTAAGGESPDRSNESTGSGIISRHDNGGQSESETNPATERPSILVLALTLAAILGIVIAFRTGITNRLVNRVQKIMVVPFPILLSNGVTRLALPSPNWLKRWAYTASLTPIERSFVVVFQSLRWLGAGASPTETPAEAAQTLARLLPEVAEEIRSLLKEYEHAVYSQSHAYLFRTRQMEDVIRRLALKTAYHQWIVRFKNRFLQIFSG